MSQIQETNNSDNDGSSVFIVGCPRSGTTLLASMLNAHKNVAVMGETHFIPLVHKIGAFFPSNHVPKRFLLSLFVRNGRLKLSAITRSDVIEALGQDSYMSVGESVGRLHRWYAKNNNVDICGDKTPAYVLHLKRITAMRPEARFIHIIRDGRNVSHSLISKRWGPNTYSGAAYFWHRHVTSGRRAGAVIGANKYLEVRYEELVENSEVELKKICTFLSQPYDPEMLNFHNSGTDFSSRNFDPSIHQRLKFELKLASPAIASSDAALIEELVGDSLMNCGYPVESTKRASLVLRTKAFLEDSLSQFPFNRERMKTLLGMRR